MSARAPDDLSDSRAHAKARAFFGHSCTRERPGVFRGLELRAYAKGRAFFGDLAISPTSPLLHKPPGQRQSLNRSQHEAALLDTTP